MASAIVNPLLAAEPFEEASEGPRSPTSEKEMQLFYEEQERQDMHRRLSRRNSRAKSWRRSLIGRAPSAKNVHRPASEADSDAYGTGKLQEEMSNPRSPSPTPEPTAGPSFRHPSNSAPATPGWGPGAGVGVFANSHRKPVPGRASTIASPASSQMMLPAHYVRDQSHIPWHLRKYEIYQPPAIGARAPPRYYNYHLLSAHARERLERANSQGMAGRVPMIPSLNGSMFSGVGSGMNTARSSLAARRPSLLGALSPTGGSAGIAGLETITASPASTAAALNSPSLDPMNALNSGPAGSHRLSTLLKRPPASPHTFSQPLPTDATDLIDGTDPFGSIWHHSSPYDAGEMVVGRGFGRAKDTGTPENTTPHSRPGMLSPIATSSSVPKKGPSPLSQSTSAINLTDTEPPLPEPPGSPDLLSSTRVKRKLSKRRSSSGNGRGGLGALFGRKPSVEDDGGVDGRGGGLRGRSRPPLSPSSQSLAQPQGIAFPSSPVDGEKRVRKKLSKRNRSGSMSSAASVDSLATRQSYETPIHAQFSHVLDGAGREVMIEELPSAKPPREPPQKPRHERHPSQHQPPSQPTRPASQQPQRHRPPSEQQHHHEPPMSAPPTTRPMPIPAPASAPTPPVTTKPPRERKISAASINSFLSRITSRDKDKDKDRDEKHPPRSASAQETDRKIAPHMLLNHVGPGGKRKSGSNVFGRLARKLSLIRRRSADVLSPGGQVEPDERLDAALRPLNGRPSFQVERPMKKDMTGNGATRSSSVAPAPGLQRRATLDMGAPPPAPPPQGPGPEDLFAPLDPKLRSSRLINTPFTPPPRIPDLAIPADRGSWASLHRHVSNARPPKSEVGAAVPAEEALAVVVRPKPTISTDELVPPPPLGGGGKHPDSPHSIPKWGIANGAPRGPGLITSGSPTDDSPMSLPRTMLTVANPDLVDSETESGVASAERKNKMLPPDPPMSPPPARKERESMSVPMKRESVKPLVVNKDRSRSRSRTPSPVKPNVELSGRESPVKKSQREGKDKERGRDREPRREPVRRTEPLKDHSADMGSPAGASLRTSIMANGSTTSVDAIHGDDDVEFGARPAEKGDIGRGPRPRPSVGSIGKIQVVTPKTSLQKIRARVVSNPAPIQVTKESSPVKEEAPELFVSSPEPIDSVVPAAGDSRPSSVAEPPARPARSKSRPRSAYTGGESKHSIYGTASNVSVDEYSEDAGSVRASPAGPRKRISVADSEAAPVPPSIPVRSASRASPHMTPDMRAHMNAKLADPNGGTPYMTPTDEHHPLHPFSDKPVEYRNLMPSIAPISVMRVETSMPPFKGSVDEPENLKAGLSEFDLAPPKAPFMNESFSVSKEKLAAQSEFKKASQSQSQSHKRESTAESERDRRRAKEAAEREDERIRARERAERVERHERERAERAERAERERLDREQRERERERIEFERLEREQLERERAEQEREARERAQRAERERHERERIEWEKAVERARAEQLRVEQERERAERERAEQLRLERDRARAEKEAAERDRQERHRMAQLKRDQEREREREIQRVKDLERQAREREYERLEKERLEKERLEREQEMLERERVERIRAERLEWERQEQERLELIEMERQEREQLERERLEQERMMEEELRQREREGAQPPPLIHSRQSSSGGTRRRHEYDGEREVHVMTMKEARKASKRRTPNHSRSTSPTSTVPPPPPPKDYKTRQRSRTDASSQNVANVMSPPPAIEVLGGVPVLPQGTHVEVTPSYIRASSEEGNELSTLKAREAWERERLDKGQSVLVPGVQRAVIPDTPPARPTPDPRQHRSASKGRSQTAPSLAQAEPYVLPPVQIHPSASTNMLPSEYGPTHSSYVQPSYPQPVPPSRSHNPLPKPPSISGPVPLHSRPSPTYTNPNRQARPGGSRNPLPVPPRVSPYPMHHNVSPPRVHPPGAVDARAPGRWETMPS
ncbi:S-formylglutathione hydrolase [Ceratobasidium sp. AG-Ba]|nr:S-formylglutathione hydrolase [Ceratobasidium sp. AG-Ba]